MNIQKIVSFLAAEDKIFDLNWSHKTDEEKKRYIHLWTTLDQFVSDKDIPELIQLNHKVYNLTRGYCSIVQEKEFSFSSLPRAWKVTVNNNAKLKNIHEYNRERILKFIKAQNAIDVISFYGGIKSYRSISEKFFHIKNGSIVRRNVEDLWDLVRYRIVVKDLSQLCNIGIKFWDVFFDSIIRCRNYYYLPRAQSVSDAYRAMHFQIVDDINGMSELQIVTELREAVSLIDHSIMFKKSISVDEEIKDWLFKLSLATNILDYNQSHLDLNIRFKKKQIVK